MPYAADNRYSSICNPRHPRSLIPLLPHQPIDFDAEVNLFHFNLLRCVGKGAFGKVCAVSSVLGGVSPCSSPRSLRHCRSGLSSTSRRRISTPSSTSTKLAASNRKPFRTSFRRGGCSKRSVATRKLPRMTPATHFSFDLRPLSSPSRRSITLSSLTCVMPFKTTRTAFSSSTSCSGATSDVRVPGWENDQPPLKRLRLFLTNSIYSPPGAGWPSI